MNGLSKHVWKIYGLFIAGTEAVGALSGFLTRNGTKPYQVQVVKPPLNPPAVVFPVVWGILYALMGAGAARVWMRPPSKARTNGLWIFFVQLAVNFLWSIIFFKAELLWGGVAVIVLLLILIAVMLTLFYKLDKVATFINIPYLLWVLFAAYLNIATAVIN